MTTDTLARHNTLLTASPRQPMFSQQNLLSKYSQNTRLLAPTLLQTAGGPDTPDKFMARTLNF